MAAGSSLRGILVREDGEVGTLRRCPGHAEAAAGVAFAGRADDDDDAPSGRDLAQHPERLADGIAGVRVVDDHR